jgi:glucose/arabinose dehydrogenase
LPRAHTIHPWSCKAPCTLIAPLLVGPVGAAVLEAQETGPLVEVVADGLEVPWSMAFAPDGRLFVAERPGRIRVIDEGGLVAEPWVALPAASPTGTEAGLMGLAIDPAFASTGFVYACYSFSASDGGIRNRIVRLRESDGRGSEETILLDDLPGHRYQDGCRLGFGPDGMLYATTGDATDESLPQDSGSLAGKVLRMRPDGGVPDDNPFGGSLVWSLGHRNSQGITWEPESGVLWATEHGSDGYNELNRIVRGGNYGWPIVRSEDTDDRFLSPAAHLREIPPAGIAFIADSRYPHLDGGLVFSALGGGSLMFGRVTGEGTIEDIEQLIDDRFGRLRDVVLGPDGSLYVATSNRDQLGDPSPDDDRILRIVEFGR